MKKELQISHRFHRTRGDIFNYWIRPELFERWGAFDGMTLKVNRLEAKKGGKYSMVHTGLKAPYEGQFVCNGYFKEFIPNEKLVQVDSILGPDGTEMFHDLECVTEFIPTIYGTDIIITQSGFPDEKSRDETLRAWEQCFANLDELLGEKYYKEVGEEKLTTL